MRRVLIAPDKFKGTLSAPQAAEAMARGLLRFQGDSPCEIIARPLADGGEGSHDTLIALRPDYRLEHRDLPDCSGRTISVPFSRDSAGNRFLETALVMGLLLPGARTKPVMERSTAGVGLWLRDYLDEPADLRLFLGGSATSDGGFGLARALGMRFVRADGGEVENFREITAAVRVIFPTTTPRARVIAHTDVASPLTGPAGAARLFAGQKGADADEIAAIEKNLEHMLALFNSASGTHAKEPDGSGAAGGLALPLLFWPALDARIQSGIDFFLEQAELPELFRAAPPDLVLTGEGATDRGTLQGKAIEGLRRIRGHVPLMVFSGIVRDREALEAAGYDAVFGTDEVVGPFEMLARGAAPAELTAEAARRLEETVYRGLVKSRTGR